MRESRDGCEVKESILQRSKGRVYLELFELLITRFNWVNVLVG
jgi:hypothetical protein